MLRRTRIAARLFALVLLGGSILFCIALAWSAHEGSQEVGGGAAQGDLGLFMILIVISPVMLGVTALSWGLEAFALARPVWRWSPPTPVNWLAVGSVLALTWNWLYLMFFYRA
jgi:hypothetical protein